ncbi:hypothetical protein A2125_02575 [Candidatus Woesebacteria bacterium GWB1_43_5]|uniref:Uncharacterized protein n=1 Tax=Candidatus Woesebacteria bacterium GWB1_43_5 TaxID=1802474 RepID=A0A1F7WSU3_9BACT|nr:MAG: hypothetical protein A2125_02575 [Candidatus Woesebacteria bacterium GWB1_43_5]
MVLGQSLFVVQASLHCGAGVGVGVGAGVPEGVGEGNPVARLKLVTSQEVVCGAGDGEASWALGMLVGAVGATDSCLC